MANQDPEQRARGGREESRTTMDGLDWEKDPDGLLRAICEQSSRMLARVEWEEDDWEKSTE